MSVEAEAEELQAPPPQWGADWVRIPLTAADGSSPLLTRLPRKLSIHISTRARAGCCAGAGAGAQLRAAIEEDLAAPAAVGVRRIRDEREERRPPPVCVDRGRAGHQPPHPALLRSSPAFRGGNPLFDSPANLLYANQEIFCLEFAGCVLSKIHLSPRSELNVSGNGTRSPFNNANCGIFNIFKQTATSSRLWGMRKLLKIDRRRNVPVRKQHCSSHLAGWTRQEQLMIIATLLICGAKPWCGVALHPPQHRLSFICHQISEIPASWHANCHRLCSSPLIRSTWVLAYVSFSFQLHNSQRLWLVFGEIGSVMKFKWNTSCCLQAVAGKRVKSSL